MSLVEIIKSSPKKPANSAVLMTVSVKTSCFNQKQLIGVPFRGIKEGRHTPRTKHANSILNFKG